LRFTPVNLNLENSYENLWGSQMSKCDFTAVKYFTPVNSKFTTCNFLKITAVKCFPAALRL